MSCLALPFGLTVILTNVKSRSGYWYELVGEKKKNTHTHTHTVNLTRFYKYAMHTLIPKNTESYEPEFKNIGEKPQD